MFLGSTGEICVREVTFLGGVSLSVLELELSVASVIACVSQVNPVNQAET